MKSFNNVTEVENLKFNIKSTIEKINETNDLSSKYILRRKFDELIEQYCFLCNKLNIEI